MLYLSIEINKKRFALPVVEAEHILAIDGLILGDANDIELPNSLVVGGKSRQLISLSKELFNVESRLYRGSRLIVPRECQDKIFLVELVFELIDFAPAEKVIVIKNKDYEILHLATICQSKGGHIHV